jgi:hypothetical protein
LKNEAGAVSAVVAQASRIAAETGAAVVFAHHPGKDAERGMRGSYALSADFDTVIRIEREPGSPVRNVVLEKAKDGEEGPVGSFSLNRVVLGRDDDGDDITSCVVRLTDQPAETASKRPPPHTASGKALNELEHLIIAGRGAPSRGHHRIPDGATLIRRDEWQAACLAKQLSSGEPDSERRIFRRAVDQLTASGLIGAFGEHVWPVQHRARIRTKKGCPDVHGTSGIADTAGQSSEAVEGRPFLQ